MYPDQYGISIDKKSPVSVADQIANDFSKKILSGQMKPDEKLPAERDLASALGISRGTVKRAYSKLERACAIEIRKGSGSYVLRNGRFLELNRKKEATEILSVAFSRLHDMGISNKEILNLINLHVSIENSMRRMNIMVVSNNHEILSELEQQLSYLSSASMFLFRLSFFTLDTVRLHTDPVQMLFSYDLIIATSIDYPDMVKIAPMFRHRMIEAGISPSSKTLMELSSLPENARVNIIYRTDVFRSIVEKTLYALGFEKSRIFSCPEADYHPAHHSDHGIRALINFNESPVYVNPAFRERNEEFIRNGGSILRFEYRIERNSLIDIENRIQDLLRESKKESR